MAAFLLVAAFLPAVRNAVNVLPLVTVFDRLVDEPLMQQLRREAVALGPKILGSWWMR